MWPAPGQRRSWRFNVSQRSLISINLISPPLSRPRCLSVSAHTASVVCLSLNILRVRCLFKLCTDFGLERLAKIHISFLRCPVSFRNSPTSKYEVLSDSNFSYKSSSYSHYLLPFRHTYASLRFFLCSCALTTPG